MRPLAQRGGAGDARVWLSKPARTLRVPDLTGEDGGGGRAFRPASVLLCVAGTGIVALPQLLAHRDPMKLLGISTPRRDQLHVPIDLVYSCREDDVLMLPQLAQWCRDGGGGDASGVRRCTLLLTPANAQPGCFGDAAGGTAAEAEELLQSLPNVRIVRSQLSAEEGGHLLAERLLGAEQEVIEWTRLGSMQDVTLRLIAERRPRARIFGFDSFEGFPETHWPWVQGVGDLERQLPELPASVGVVPGWFNETLPPFVAKLGPEDRVTFLHVDCDLYSSTKTVFEFLGPRLAPYCWIEFDELLNYREFRDHEVKDPNEGGQAVNAPRMDVNLFNMRVGRRGVGGDVAAQGLILGSASVCLFVCLFVYPGWVGGWAGCEFRGKERTIGPNDSGEQDLQKVKET